MHFPHPQMIRSHPIVKILWNVKDVALFGCCLHLPPPYKVSPFLPPSLPAASAFRTPNAPPNNLLYPPPALPAPYSMIYKILPKTEGR